MSGLEVVPVVRRSLALLVVLATPALEANPVVKKSEKGIEYSIRVPQNYDKSRGAMLVIGLHGSGDKQSNLMNAMANSMKWLDKAIVVTPQAPNASAQWNQDDVDAITDLVRELQDEHHPPRTVLYGFSAGAYFSFGIGSRLGDRVQAAIPNSGGLGIGLGDDAKKVVWYVIHGDQDEKVNVEESRKAVKALKDAGAKVEYEEMKGKGHVIDYPSVQRAFEWVEKTLGPCPPELSEKESSERLSALDKAIKAKEWDTVAKGLLGLEFPSARSAGKVFALAKQALACPDDNAAAAAARILGRYGAQAIAPLKAAPQDRVPVAQAAAASLAQTGQPQAADALLAFLKGKSQETAVAAARELKNLGGDIAIAALVAGLQANEASKTPDDRKAAINASLKKLTGQSFETSKDWKRWITTGK
jgi:predicted esterase